MYIVQAPINKRML